MAGGGGALGGRCAWVGEGTGGGIGGGGGEDGGAGVVVVGEGDFGGEFEGEVV